MQDLKYGAYATLYPNAIIREAAICSPESRLSCSLIHATTVSTFRVFFV